MRMARTVQHEHSDISDSPLASYWPDLASEIDTVEDCAREVCSEAVLVGISIGITLAASLITKTVERCGGVVMNVTAHETIERIAGYMLDTDNPRLASYVLAFTAGLFAPMGMSETKIAEKLGITRAAFSKRVKNLQALLALPPSRGMKSAKASQVYKVTNGKI